MACRHSSRDGLRQGCAGRRADCGEKGEKDWAECALWCGERNEPWLCSSSEEKILRGALGILNPVCRQFSAKC